MSYTKEPLPIYKRKISYKDQKLLFFKQIYFLCKVSQLNMEVYRELFTSKRH